MSNAGLTNLREARRCGSATIPSAVEGTYREQLDTSATEIRYAENPEDALRLCETYPRIVARCCAGANAYYVDVVGEEVIVTASNGEKRDRYDRDDPYVHSLLDFYEVELVCKDNLNL